MPKKLKNQSKVYLSIPQYARQVGLSRIAIYKQVKKGLIPAKKVGRNYVIPTDSNKENIREAITKKQISLPALAKKLGISRIAVYQRVKSGQIIAEKVGRNYVIPAKEYKRDIPPKPVKSIVKIKKFMTIPELARQMGLSRIAVYKKVKSGQIKAEKIGRNYMVAVQEIFDVMPKMKKSPVALTKEYKSIPQQAKKMGISRFALYQKVKKGEVKATKVGRSFIVSKKNLGFKD